MKVAISRIVGSRRSGRCGAALLVALLAVMPAYARPHHSDAWAREHFARAEHLREALNARPPAERTRRDYQRVINAYRNVFFGSPASTKADPSVVAVAETLLEMGRSFNDPKILKEAIAQYRFLRREYPGSKYRTDALFTIAEIYQEDLNDAPQARSAFEEFIHRYPHNQRVEDARHALAELDHRPANKTEEAKLTGSQPASDAKAKPEEAAAESSDGKEKDSDTKDTNKDSSDNSASASSEKSAHPRIARVTGIRHWSTADSTHVAIDLQGDVKFTSERIEHPERIYFDLRGTRLAHALIGKTFDVEDGFLTKIRIAQFQPGRTRVVLEVKDLSDYEAVLVPNPYRLIIDIHGRDIHGKNAWGKLPKASGDTGSDTLANSETPEAAGDLKSDLLLLAGRAPVTSMDVPDGTRISARVTPQRPTSLPRNKRSTGPIKRVVEADDDSETPAPKVSTARRGLGSRSRRKHAAEPASDDTASEIESREAQPTANGDRSLIRALGLKIGKIVIDPGHGGHDTGTIGPNGLEEKNLVLDVGLRLGKLLESRLGAEVVFTRSDDTFIPLERRTAIANQERADLFISIHANSSHDPDARGVETYYLNFTSSASALEVAARENAGSEKSIYELQDLVKKIALKEKIEESREFASDVETALHSGLAAKSPGIRDRGVKKAPFIVLIGANMPSILSEISFVSNPADERHLETGDYRQKIAESLYRGIAKYVNGLSGVKVASKIEKTAGGQ